MGAWGTALAVAAAKRASSVNVWARESALRAEIDSARTNARYLPGITLPSNIFAAGDLAKAVAAEAILVAVPTQALRATLEDVGRVLKESKPVILCAKGIEKTTGLLA